MKVRGLAVLAAACWLALAGPAARAQEPAATDSLRLANLRQIQLEDSLALGLGLFGELLRQQERNLTDSLKLEVQRGVGRDWFLWAFSAPRPSMSGRDWIRLGNLFGFFDAFDLTGAYDRQLDCYKHAIRHEATRREATLRLHNEYHRAGFAPGMLQTGQALLELDREAALRDGVAKSMALANYFLGDRKEAKRWIKLHLRGHAADPEALELQRRIKQMPRRQGAE